MGNGKALTPVYDSSNRSSVLFFAIIGVFGLRWAIAGLAVFVLDAVVACALLMMLTRV